MNIEDIKLPEAQATPEASTQGQAPVASSQVTPNTTPGQDAATTPAPSNETATKEWDGDVNKLPPELQGWAKEVQRGFSKRLASEADIRRKGQEYDSFVQSQDFQAFQHWKQGQLQQPQQSQQKAEAKPVMSTQEWEDIQLDPTGTKMGNKMLSVIQQEIQKAAQNYGMELQGLKNQQQVTQFQSALSDFADVHPEVIEFHGMGLMEPFIKEELNKGTHKTYESVIASAHERASKVIQVAEQKALEKTQGRVIEKKGVVTSTGTASGEANSFVVDSPKDVFEQAFNFAAQNKKVKVRAKR